MRFYTNVSRNGSKILYRGYDFGEKVTKKVNFSPKLYLENNKEPSKYKSIHGVNLQEKKFDSFWEAKEFSKTFNDVENFEVHGNINYISQYIQDQYPGNIKFDTSKIHINYLDIEVSTRGEFVPPEVASAPINTIGVYSTLTKKYHLFSTLKYDKQKTKLDISPNDIVYYYCKDEIDLYDKFITFWVNDYPDVLTGWYSRMYDIPYIVNRAQHVFPNDPEEVIRHLSPWGKVSFKEVKFKGRNLSTYEIAGVSHLDYLDVFQKFGYTYGPQISYKLNDIANLVLGEKKLSYDEYSSLEELEINDPQKYLDYNIKDVNLIKKMEEKDHLLELVFTMAYRAGVNFEDTFGTIGIWDTIIYRYLDDQNIAIPPKKISYATTFPGGYVKEVQEGMFEWVISLDLNSLYPNILVQYNMSTEMIIQESCDSDVLKLLTTDFKNSTNFSMTANGALFKKEKQGFLPAIVEKYYKDRVIAKSEMLSLKSEREKGNIKLDSEISTLDNMQMAIKILLNSLYGSLGNRYSRYYDLRIASGITLTGQLTVRWAEKYINEYLNKILKTENKDYVIAIDTDSCYVNVSDIVSKHMSGLTKEEIISKLDLFSRKKLEPVIKKAYDNLFEKMGAYKPRMKMGRENIGKAVWVAKKRYIMNVFDSEGVRYTEPKLKIMGLEAVKSSTPEICKDKFKKVFKVIMDKDEQAVQDFIQNFKEEFSSKAPHEIAFPRGITNIKKWEDDRIGYKSRCPIHVRAAISHNKMLYELGIKKYEYIGAGSKIKFLYLKTPNPSGQHVIGFMDHLPDEFKLHKYIDIDAQFSKTFLEPLILILKAIGWKAEYEHDLMELYGE